jgi:glycosyltransferase involved in cell wall biosynthesis
MSRIAFVSTNDWVPWGGSEVFWSELAKLLAQRGHEIAFSVQRWDPVPGHIRHLLDIGAAGFWRSQEWQILARWKYAVNRLPPRKYQFKPDHRQPYRILSEFRPDLVFLSLGDHNSSVEWMEECLRLGIPYVLVVQLVKDGSYPYEMAERHYSRLRHGYLSARRVLCTSRDNEYILEKQFATRLENTELIYNPIRRLPRAVRYPERATYGVAVVARLDCNHKGQEVLFEVLRGERWRDRPVEFNLYGDGPHAQMLSDLRDYWRLENVHLRGFQTLESIWERNHILLLPSRSEGLSLAFLEAMSCARTAIVTRVGDAERFIEDNESGFIIRCINESALSDTLERAWERRDDWEAMGRLCQQRLDEMIPEDPVRAFADRVPQLLASDGVGIAESGLAEE